MKIKKTIILLLIACFISSCSSSGGNNGSSVNATQQASVWIEEAAVYSALISSRYVQGNVQRIVIRDHTGLDPQDDLEMRLEYVHKNMPELTQAMVTDFKVKNEKPFPLSSKLDLDIQYALISQERWQQIFTATDLDGDWEEFYRIYPNSQGILTLSRVGFNNNLDMALVYVGNQSGGLAGAGYYLLMAKENNTWKVIREDMAWIS